MKRIGSLFLFLSLLASPAIISAQLPQPTGLVTDAAHVLSPQIETKLENLLIAFERQSSIEIAIATLPSLEEEPIENVAVQLFETWGIGKKGKDNGLLFLIAPNERKTRIEVGYGLEGVINDALAGRLLDEVVLPQFKAGDVERGIAAGALAIIATIAHKENIPFDVEGNVHEMGLRPAGHKQGPQLPWPFKLLFFLVLGYLFIRHPWLFLFLLATSGRGGGGGGFSRGFGGFGGGLSGGGGASRGW